MALVKSTECLHLKADSETGRSLHTIDAQIRQLFKACKMPSDFIELDYQSEPSFIGALNFHGSVHDLVLIKPENFSGLAGLGVRSVRQAYLGGQPAALGYLHHLRLHPAIRGGPYLLRGYRQIRNFYKKNEAPLTLTSILADNHTAKTLLEAKRSSMPAYKKVCDYLTALIPLSGPGKRWPFRKRQKKLNPSLSTAMLQKKDINKLLKLFGQAAEVFDGIPLVTENSFADSHSSVFPGLQIEDFVGVFYNNELIAACGIWNQQQYRQIMVSKLCNSLRIARSIWQAGQKFWGKCPVPAPGNQVNQLLLDPWIFKPGYEKFAATTLLKEAIKVAKKAGADFAAWGIAQNHSAAFCLHSFMHIPYRSSIYQVYWPENGPYNFRKNHLQLINLGAL